TSLGESSCVADPDGVVKRRASSVATASTLHAGDAAPDEQQRGEQDRWSCEPGTINVPERGGTFTVRVRPQGK
ncbi:MAG TPA: hypothetical protein VFD82_18655, partial [Planctomycetota bacterium]|nr:hypothetical protein [Planctomycetota bacterium]